MSSRSNQLLVGIIVLLLGLLILAQRYVHVDLGSLMLIAGGGALVVLYKTKHKNWSLILGGYMMYAGAANIIKYYVSGFDALNIIGAMFFIVPGVIFFILFFEKKRPWQLFAASFMVWLGLFQIVKNISFIGVGTFSLLLASIGLAFYTINLFGKGLVSRWAFDTGTIFIVLSVIFSGIIGRIIGLLGGLPQTIAIILILFSGVIIINALKKRKE